MLAERQMNSHQNSPRRAYNLYYANGNIRGRFEWRLNRSSSTTIIVVGGQRRIRSGSTRAECYQAFSSSSFISLFSLAFSASCPHPLSLSFSLFFDSLTCKTDRRTYYAVYVHVIIPSMPRIFKSLESLARDTLWIDWEIFPVIEVLAGVVPQASPTPLISRRFVNESCLEPRSDLQNSFGTLRVSHVRTTLIFSSLTIEQ